MLACIHLAEEGILRLIFAAVYLMFQKTSNDNEVSAASRYDALFLVIVAHLIKFSSTVLKKLCQLSCILFQNCNSCRIIKQGPRGANYCFMQKLETFSSFLTMQNMILICLVCAFVFIDIFFPRMSYICLKVKL